MSKRALLVIDMLNDFLLPGAPLEVPAGRNIIPCILEEIKAAREGGVPVIYLCDNHAPDDPEFVKWPAHCVSGTKGAEVVDELSPEEGDIVVPKTRYSGFFKTDLDGILKNLDVSELTLTGILTNICVLFTSCDAFMRGFNLRIPEQCVAALTVEEHTFALDQVGKLMDAEIIRKAGHVG
ncbi:MAG: cysteine hydrolase [Deltaproteobacteria bacterium]|nr:cysteine hydrolase [Deltaproteobacteria bacterium]